MALHQTLLLSALLFSSAVANLTPLSYCSNTHHPSLCHALLSSGDFKSGKDVTLAAINQILPKLNAAITQAKELARQARAANNIRRATYLNVCVDEYSLSIESYDRVLEVIGSGSDPAEEIETNIDTARTSINMCREWWVSEIEYNHPHDFPFEKENRKLFALGNNILDYGKGLGGKL